MGLYSIKGKYVEATHSVDAFKGTTRNDTVGCLEFQMSCQARQKYCAWQNRYQNNFIFSMGGH